MAEEQKKQAPAAISRLTFNGYYIYIQIMYFKFIFFHALLLLVHSQTLLPISNCLSNCLGCERKNPNTCVQRTSGSGQNGRCVPYYDGINCSTGNSYYNIYNENGVLGNFANWSLPSQLQQCPILNESSSVAGIGLFNSSFPAKKTLQFSPSQGVRRLLIKIGVVVSDDRLSSLSSNGSFSSNGSQQVSEVEQNDTIVITTINTQTNGSSPNGTIPFLTMKLYDLLNKNSVVASAATGYRSPSPTLTKCGHVYQYQFTAASNTSFQQMQLELALPAGSATLWWLMDFTVQAGCSGFAAGANCASCLTNFYPIATQQGYPNGCKHCPFACATCAENGLCLTCELYATLNATTKSCYYPQRYLLYSSSNFSARVGSLQTASYAFSQIYRSQNRILNFGLQLANNQSYLLKFYLLYPESYAQNKTNFNFSIDGNIWTTSSLDYSKATLSDVNNGQHALFVLPYTIDRMGTTGVKANGSLLVQLTLPHTDEFYLADLQLVQYQCSKNCLDCVFNLVKTSSCRACLPFYRSDTNCLTCANGFFQAIDGTRNRCVKCYSNCKQCMGSQNFQCLECFSNFELQDLAFNTPCITEIVNQYSKNIGNISSIGNCPGRPSLKELSSKANCLACLSTPQGTYSHPNCISCWLSYNYVWGRCQPKQSSGLTFYASDIDLNSSSTAWSAKGLVQQNCTADYPGLLGVANLPNNANHSSAVPSTLNYSLSGLPSHFGLTFHLDVFKIDYWGQEGGKKSANPLNLQIIVDQLNAVSLPLSNSMGANICQEQSNEMIWTLQANIAGHSTPNATIQVVSPDNGIFVRQLTVYLGNCPQCGRVSLSYAISLLPVYDADDSTQTNSTQTNSTLTNSTQTDSTQTGLYAFVVFNKPISFISNQQNDPAEAFAESFTFSVGQDEITNYSIKENKINDTRYNYIKYFLPLNASYVNTTVTASTSKASLVYSQDAVATRLLAQPSQSVRLQRFNDIGADSRNSISQLSLFFQIWSWFALIGMIVAVGLGVGVVLEEFSIVMQVIYYHIYITSGLLPASVKIPLAHAARMEHLNYFGSIASIENSLFGLEPLIPSNYIYTQFNIDVYFLRSIYPILIINAVFIGWFLILKLLKWVVPTFRLSSSRPARFFRSIPDRPLAYFDQIWRYQYLAVMWACMLQFSNFLGEGPKQKVNLAICVLAFVVSFVWPFIITVYHYCTYSTTNAKHFLYLYHDIYYLKMSSLSDRPKYYLYVAMKTGRLLAYAVFIGLFINQTIIGPVLLIFINLIDGCMAFFLNIYRTGPYLLTRIIENLLLIISAILFLAILGVADDPDFKPTHFEDLGFGLSTVFVLIVINGFVRFIYLIYKKWQQWSIGTYDVGEHGQLENFDEKTPVKLAQQSERL